MKNKPKYWYKQSSVIPFRKNGNKIELLLITSRKKKKWLFPKGIIEENLSSRESSVQEAFEEGGIKGQLLPHKIGTYFYKKWGGKCKVKVYALKVETILDEWEENFRDRKWISIDELQNYIYNDDIIEITNRLKQTLKNIT